MYIAKKYSSRRWPSSSHFTNVANNLSAVTMNKFGKGNAIYLATESNSSTIGSLMNYLYKVSDIQPGPKTPKGVYARVVDGQTLFVNTTDEVKRIHSPGIRKGMISNRITKENVILGPKETDLIQ